MNAENIKTVKTKQLKTDQSPNRQIAKSPDARRARTDFVRFKLRATAPDFVAIGGARFSGAYRRAAEPFECTRGEWKVFVERTGFFEEEKETLTGESDCWTPMVPIHRDQKSGTPRTQRKNDDSAPLR